MFSVIASFARSEAMQAAAAVGSWIASLRRFARNDDREAAEKSIVTRTFLLMAAELRGLPPSDPEVL